MDNMETTKGAGVSTLTYAGACTRNREFDIPVRENSQGENYFRSIIIKDTIRNSLKLLNATGKQVTRKDVMQYMLSRYCEAGFKHYQQKQETLAWDVNRVMRYLRSENRKASFPAARTVMLGNTEVSVHVDAAFACGDQVTLVLYKIGKPNGMTQSGRNNDFARDMQLYSLILYGRALGYHNIQAAFYFLRKDSDSSNWSACEQSFFGGGGNVIEMTDIWDGTDEPNELDKQMAGKILLNDTGIDPDEIREEHCEYCKIREICKYKLPPVKAEEAGADSGKPLSAALAKVSYTKAQQEAIDARDPFIRVIAGAGTGKTKTMVGRVAALLNSGVKPEEILMVTFTKAGAKEFAERVAYAMEDPGAVEGLKVSTFNAFFNDIVNDNFEELGFARKPKVIDMVEQFSIIDDILVKNPIVEWKGPAFMNYSVSKGFGCRGALMIAKAVFREVKIAKAEGADPLRRAQAIVGSDEICGPALTKLVKLYDQYEDITKSEGLIDFDDQPLLAFRILRDHPGYLDSVCKYRHIIVDEFQDTSAEQIEFLKELVKIKTFETLMVVGDDYQAIYGFRDTSPDYIINFESYIGHKVRDIKFLENWRSRKQILEFGGKVIERNGEDQVAKDLLPMRGDGSPVTVQGFYKKPEEIDFIVRGIKNHIENGMEPKDIAVLCYTKDELRSVADKLTEEGVPSFFGAPEPIGRNSRIVATLEFAKLCISPENGSSVICANALLGGDIWSLTKDEIEEKCREVENRAAEIRSLPEVKQKEAFLMFVADIAYGDEVIESFAEGFENKSFEEIVEYCGKFALYGDGVEYTRTSEYPGVCLVTAHSSKGREWPVVYMSVTKYQRPHMGRRDAQEMRRLMYVSATRARNELYVTGLYGTGSEATGGRVMNAYVEEAYEAAGQMYAPVWPDPVSRSGARGRKK